MVNTEHSNSPMQDYLSPGAEKEGRPDRAAVMNMSGELENLIGPAHSTENLPSDFDELSDEQTALVLELASHLHEVATGSPWEGPAREQYNPEQTSQETRIQRKLSELETLGMPMSRATFYRKLTAYRTDGITGLIDRRSLRQFPPLERLPEDVLAELLTVMDEQSHKSTTTVQNILATVRARVVKRHGINVPMPSTATMYRHVRLLGAGRQLTGSAKTRRSLAERPDRTFRKNPAFLPGQEIQIDSTPLDVLVRTPEGKAKRPVLTVMLDVATRSILASTIRLEATKAVDHVLLLAQALTPRESRPNREVHRQLMEFDLKGQSLLRPSDYERLAAQQPYIFPRRIQIDNGRDYLSTTFRAAAERFGVALTLSAPHTPTGKPHVERTFGSINTLWAQNLPGYVGRSAEHRGQEPNTDDLLTVEQVWELFDDWVLEIWQNRPHDSLVDRLNPAHKFTPNEVATEATSTYAQVQVPLGQHDYVALLDTAWRRIHSTGVQLNNRYYDSDDLHPHRGMRSGHTRHDGKWKVKFDPYNVTGVWVELGRNNFVYCPERGIDSLYLQPDLRDISNEDRTVTARTHAEITGTPLPQRPEEDHTPDTDTDTDEFEFEPF